MQAIVNDLLTNYQLQGTGQLVLFLHGWGDASTGSLALQKELAQSYTVLAPDLPGFGKTQMPPNNWGLDEYADWLTALLAKLDLEQPYAVIGHSNGGAIAIRAMATNKLQPQKLVLLASAGIRTGRTMRRALLQIVAKGGNLATIWLPVAYRRRLRQKLYTSAGSDLLAVEHMQGTFKKVTRQDVQADAAKLTQPALLIFGANDTAVPPYMAKRYQSLIPNAQLHLLPNAGHFVHLDESQTVTQLIEEFLHV